MKILLVSQDGVGAWFTLRLIEEGHSVDYYLLKDKYYNVLNGIAPIPLKKKPDFSNYDVVVFDLTGSPALAEEAVKATPTLGDGDLQTELEEDRLFGINIMEECDINVPFYDHFNDLTEAKKFIRKTNKRYVFKPFGDQSTAATYVSENAEDLLKYLDKLSSSSSTEFILQEVVDGTEVSTEAWFNGEEFTFINGTLEEKKFMNDRKGPNTGCSGNLVWVYDQPPAIFNQGLGRLKDFLTEYKYKGMVDLNTIASQNELYGLEWTPRFGYDASATLFALLQRPSLGEFFEAIASGSKVNPITNGNYSAGIRLSIPPYPSEVDGKHPEGIPINGLDPDHDDISHCYYLYDAMLNEEEELVTAGISGFVCVPMHTGTSIREVFAGVDEKIKKIKIPDMQYRTDLEKCITKRFDTLQAQGWFR